MPDTEQAEKLANMLGSLVNGRMKRGRRMKEMKEKGGCDMALDVST